MIQQERYRIAFVDDEPWALIGMQEIIDWESYGFTRAYSFSSAEEAQETLAKDPVDAVITDIQLPEMSGLELAGTLLRTGLTHCAVIVSAYRDFEYARKAIEEHVMYYLLKPLEEAEVRRVAEMLRERLSALPKPQIEALAPAGDAWDHHVYLTLDSAGQTLPDADTRPADVPGHPRAQFIICQHVLPPALLKPGMSRRHSSLAEWKDMIEEARASRRMDFTYVENETISAIQFFVAMNYRERLKNSDIAQRFYLSEAYMCELFKKCAGITLGNFLINVRIRQAMRLLERTDLLVSDVAEQVGYEDAGYFGRIFRKRVEESPERYRQRTCGK